MAELVANRGFETDLANWAVFFSSCTIARSTAQARSGVASCALTASGANNYIGINETALDIVAGNSYATEWWVRVPTGGIYTPHIQPANGGWDRFGSAVELFANNWTLLEVDFVAGAWTAGATDLTFRLDRSSGTYSGEVVYFDDMSLQDAAAGVPRLALLGVG